MYDFESTKADPRFILALLKDCRSAHKLDELQVVVERLIAAVGFLDEISMSVRFSDGRSKSFLGNALSESRLTDCTQSRCIDAGANVGTRAPREQDVCLPEETAIINIYGDFGSACQKGIGKVDSTCLTAKLTTHSPPTDSLEIFETLLPHLHDALNRTANKAQGDIGKYFLTQRELEVLGWVSEGKTNWEIATILDVSERTVKFHVKNLFAKMGVTRRSQIAAKAYEFHNHLLNRRGEPASTRAASTFSSVSKAS